MTKQVQKKQNTGLVNRVVESLERLQENGLRLPENYSAENALRFAEFQLLRAVTPNKVPVLQHCTQDSVANALLEMVTKGLNPSKNQCYFVPYGNKLELVTSYFGEVAIAKRAGLKNIKAVTIHKEDDFSFEVGEDGKKKILEHKQTLSSLDSDLVGAYVVFEYPDGTTDTDIMTMNEIRKSWQQSPTKGNSPAHRNFAGEMAKRTVINRGIKLFINSSDDFDLFINENPTETVSDAEVTQEINSNANLNEIDITDVDFEEVENDAKESAEKAQPKAQPKAEKPPF